MVVSEIIGKSSRQLDPHTFSKAAEGEDPAFVCGGGGGPFRHLLVPSRYCSVNVTLLTGSGIDSALPGGGNNATSAR